MKKSTTLQRFLAESAGYFCQPTEFEIVANPDFENLKHLKSLGNLSLTKGCICD